jgi:hypothetical protein
MYYRSVSFDITVDINRHERVTRTHWTISKLANSYDEGLWFVEADARENQLSKGLRRVSRSEKIRSKVCFRAKMSKKNTFSIRILQWLGFKPGFTISSDCFTSLCSKSEEFSFYILKKWRSLDVPKVTSLFNSKKYYKTFWQSKRLVCTNPQVLLFILSF